MSQSEFILLAPGDQVCVVGQHWTVERKEWVVYRLGLPIEWSLELHLYAVGNPLSKGLVFSWSGLVAQMVQEGV